MISLNDDFVVVYYSCDRSHALRIIKGKERIRLTRYSLGRFAHGFWDDPFRALRDAIDRANNGDIKDPAVIGVIIEPGNRFNFIHPEEYLLIIKLLGSTRWNKVKKKQSGIPFDAVYCPVQDDGCGNHRAEERHGKLYISNARQIKGYFLPQPWQLFNPWLGQTGYL